MSDPATSSVENVAARAAGGVTASNALAEAVAAEASLAGARRGKLLVIAAGGEGAGGGGRTADTDMGGMA